MNVPQESMRQPRVFISYAHENPRHRAKVIRFATMLREDLGIDAQLDAWYEGNRQDWSRWALEQMDKADFVLAIASPAFRDRVDGRGDPADGRGARFEGGLLREWITRNQPDGVRRILPIVLPGNAIGDIPQLLLPYAATHYVVEELTPVGLHRIRIALAGNGEPNPPNLGTYQALTFEPVPPTGDESVLLTSLRPAHRGSDIRFHAAEINGHHYGDSIVYRPDLFCNEPRGAVEFTLGRKFRQFEAMAGVLDDAREGHQTGHFQLFADGRLRARGTTELGKPVRFRVAVTGVLRLRLVAYRADTVASPMMIGALMTSGKSGNMPELAWGDPAVTS
jgi:hypothetical protein